MLRAVDGACAGRRHPEIAGGYLASCRNRLASPSQRAPGRADKRKRPACDRALHLVIDAFRF